MLLQKLCQRTKSRNRSSIRLHVDLCWSRWEASDRDTQIYRECVFGGFFWLNGLYRKLRKPTIRVKVAKKSLKMIYNLSKTSRDAVDRKPCIDTSLRWFHPKNDSNKMEDFVFRKP